MTFPPKNLRLPLPLFAALLVTTIAALAAGNLTASYAITYLYGMVGLVILDGLLPRIMREM